MRRLTRWSGTLAEVVLLAGAAALAAGAAQGEKEEGVWARMNHDVRIMERLLIDKLAQVQSPRVEEIDGRLGEIREKLAELDSEVRKREISERERSVHGSALVRERSQLQSERSSLVGVSNADAIYLPDYGVLLVCRLRTPLAPEPTPAAPAPSSKASRWEEYRYQVRNLPRPDRGRGERGYDEEHVKGIAEAVADLLASEAQNFEALPPEERVTVFLYGPWGGKWTGAAMRYVGIEESDRTLFAIDTFGDVYAAAALPTRSALIFSVRGSDLAEQRAGTLSSDKLKRRIEISQR